MAAGSNPAMMTPPPGAGDTANPSPGVPTSPMGASPSPPTPSPGTQQSVQSIIGVVNTLRGIAKAFPAASPHVSRINDELRQITAIMMESAQPAEPAAPPVSG